MSGAQLAEVNVARLRAPIDDPEMTSLVRALDDVFWLAERSPGFVWRLRPDDGPLLYGDLDGAEVVVTLSTWTDFAALQSYVYRTAHGLFMQRRARWFVPVGGFTTAMWWVDQGSQPTVDDGLERLRHLRDRGPSPFAFSLRRQWGPDEAPVSGR
ncbi:MAG: DUF3291 domain-containing protein [Actinomycetota bacterium]